MTDLWKDDPEAFIILRLQESSDPDAAHKAFQAHLKEDAERDRALHAKSRESDALAAELAGLREERDKLHALYNRAQDDASREAEIRVNQGFEIDRLRSDLDGYMKAAHDYEAENAKLREDNDYLMSSHGEACNAIVAQRDRLREAVEDYFKHDDVRPLYDVYQEPVEDEV